MKKGQFYKSRSSELLILVTGVNEDIPYLFTGAVVIGYRNYLPGEHKAGWLADQFEQVNVKIEI